MPSDAFIKAASAANRPPVALLAIESPDAIKKSVSTQPQWLACDLVNVRISTDTGKVYLSTDGIESDESGAHEGLLVVSGSLSTNTVTYGTPPFDYTGQETDIFASEDRVIGIRFRATKINSGTGTTTARLYGRLNGGDWQLLKNFTVSSSGSTESIKIDLTRGQWDFKAWIGYTGALPTLRIDSYNMIFETHYLPTGSVTTSDTSLNLGLIPTVPSQFKATNDIGFGCSVAYSAWGRNLLTDSWVGLGSINDGDNLDPYQYYKIKADLFSADGLNTPIINELAIVGGDSQFVYLSTHKDVPIKGALPYIVSGGISTISSKIDLTQQATVGELSIKLHWRKKISDMIAGDFLKNKTIICKVGYLGLSEADFEPYFVGTWYDYQADHAAGIISVKTRNILKRFSKKIPDTELFLVKERFHIAFATSNTGANFSHSPDGKTYVGFYLDYTDADSADPAHYSWSTLNTSTGVSVGADKSAAARYLHIAFATDATGSTGFSSTSPTGKTHVGLYIDTTAADATIPGPYKWYEITADTNLLTLNYYKPETVTPITYSGNIMQVMINIVSLLGIPDRLINKAAFENLRDNSRSGTEWEVTRKFNEPADAMEMLNELSVSSGVFLFEGADGRLTAKLYDDFKNNAPVEIFDACHHKFKPIEGGQKDLYTRQAIYHNLIDGKAGDSTEDFADCLYYVNTKSEIAWSESNTREWKDKWNITDHAVKLLAERWDSWFSVPRATVRVDDVPPRFYGVERGDIVAVTNLQLPCPAEFWPGYTVGTRFLVMGKSTSDPTSGNQTVSFDLLQLEDATFSTVTTLPNYERIQPVTMTWDLLPDTWNDWTAWDCGPNGKLW